MNHHLKIISIKLTSLSFEVGDGDSAKFSEIKVVKLIINSCANKNVIEIVVVALQFSFQNEKNII